MSPKTEAILLRLLTPQQTRTAARKLISWTKTSLNQNPGSFWTKVYACLLPMKWALEDLDWQDYCNAPGWLCVCGHWQDDGLHCSVCGMEPPWGCDCNWCNDPDDWEYEDDLYWEDEYAYADYEEDENTE